MVGGKLKQAMGLHKSLSHHPLSSPGIGNGNVTTNNNNKGSSKSSSVFTRYLPRAASAQVQPRPPDVSDLLRLVHDLRDREHRLQTELLENKLLKESVSILPLLETELASKSNRIGALESHNQRLAHDLHLKSNKVEQLELQLAELNQKLVENQEISISASQRRFSVMTAKKINTRSIDTTVGSISSNRVQSFKSVFETKKEKPEPNQSHSTYEELPEVSSSIPVVRSRIPRVPKPPPNRISSSTTSDCSVDDPKETGSSSMAVPAPPPPQASLVRPPHPPPLPPSRAAPPPPPPLPVKGSNSVPTKVRRVPEVVELYHSLMRRDSRRDSGAGHLEVTAASARDLVGEIENRSAYLSAIKTDVETQGEFIHFLIKEVENAAFTDMEDVLLFVKWLDDELSYLVDERAVLKHFSWPEQKADALREAAFEYCDLKKLESEASSGFNDDNRIACSAALKKMQTIYDKLEHGAYNLSRLRESTKNRFKLFHIPVDWMLETGLMSQIKMASVKLAMTYIRRVSAGLEEVGGSCEVEELIVQGVRFAFRVHQFAGGFDVQTMRAFQELKNKANTCSRTLTPC